MSFARLGALGRGFGRGGVVVGKGSSAFVPMTPLAGAAVDIDFAAGGSYPTALSTLMNAGLTSATGALLTALQSPACSVLLYLKAAPALTGWVSFSGGSMTNAILGLTDTTTRTRDSLAVPNNLIATSGTGGFSTVASKVCMMFDATGRSIVMNNGTVVTDAQAPSTLATGGAFLNVAAAFNRLTVYTSRLADATGKGLTV